MPSSYGQAQQPFNAQIPQSLGTGGFGSTGTGGYTPYAQEIQSLGQHGIMSDPHYLPGGRQVGGGVATPLGVDPMDLITATTQGGTVLPGGRTVGGTSGYSPYGQTGYQKAAQTYGGGAWEINAPGWGPASYKNAAPGIAHALADYSLGLGPPTKGTGMDYATMGKWINDPTVQQNLPYAWTPPPGYESWQQQQNWGSLMGELNNFVNPRTPLASGGQTYHP
jgi:hypothetical protein